ncbi:MAG: type I phosphomannose isomerase catalytic subunit [Pleomorphochaeta sp.]
MIKNNEPIKLKNAKAWRTYLGGSLLRDFLGLSNTKDDHFPEEWIMSLVSARNAGRENIVNEGLSIIDDNENISLKDLISKDPSYYLGEAFSKKYNDTTGVLIKLIDSSERLSVQVHPDKNTAKKLFNSNYGKTECWHILGGREINGEKPCIYLGFKENITQEYWKDLFNKQDIKEMLNCMHKINVKIGETYLINGGIPHAIGAGCFLVEIQEPTDYTIRVERITDSGFKIADSMCHQGLGFNNMFKCFHYNGLSLDKTLNKYLISKKTINKTTSCKYESYIDYNETKMFSLYGLTIHNDTYTLKLNNVFSGIFILEGSATMKCGNSEYTIKKADEFFLPKNCKSLTFTTNDNFKLLHFYGPKV